MADDLIPDPVNPGPTPVVVGSMTPTATISGTPTVGALAAFASSTGITSATELITVNAGGQFALVGTVAIHLLYYSGTSDITLTWTQASIPDGSRVIVLNRGSGSGVIRIPHGGGGGSVIQNTVTSAPLPIAAGGQAEYVAVGGSWYFLTTHDQGAWITAPYAASDFAASGSMTWTVTAGDLAGTRYRLRGKEITYAYQLLSTTIGGTVDTHLIIKPGQFGGFTPVTAGIYFAPVAFSNSGAAYAQATGSEVDLYLVSGAAWPAGTNTAYLYGQITFEVT